MDIVQKNVKICAHKSMRGALVNGKCPRNVKQTILECIIYHIHAVFDILDCELVFNDKCPPNKFGIYVSGDWLAMNEIGITDHEGKATLRGYYYRNMFERLNESLHGSCFNSCQLFLGIYDSEMLEFFPV